MEVEVQGGDLDRAIRGLKRLLTIDNIHFEVKKRLLYVKPCEKRRAKQMLAARRRREMERKKKLRVHGQHI